MFGKPLRVLLFLIVAVSVVAGGWAIRQHKRFKHLAVHEAGMVYRSAWLDPEPLNEVIEKYQIRAVINLCTPGEMGEQRWEGERRVVTNSGARLIELEMPTTVEADDSAIAKHLEVMNNPNNYPMLVHCQHGVTRTAKHLAIYDIVYRGISGDESLAAQPLFGREEHNVNIRAFVHSFEQKRNKLYPTASAENLKVLRQ